MVEVKDVSFRYKPAGPDILHNVSFELDDGNCLAILGNNGAGKSTLLKCIDRILPAGSGTVLVDGTDVFTLGKRELARNIAYVAQNARAADMTVYDSVLLGRRPYIGWDATEHDREVVREVIDLMGIGDYELRSVAELSGGEAQKVMLARALAQEPRLLLLDEPTSNLDPRNQHEALRTVEHQRLHHPPRPAPRHPLLRPLPLPQGLGGLRLRRRGGHDPGEHRGRVQDACAHNELHGDTAHNPLPGYQIIGGRT